MPGYSFGFNDIMSLMGPFVLRTFDASKGQAAKDRQLAAGSPVLAILGTNSDEPTEWLKAGLALESMLLLARPENICSSFLNQPIEVPELRGLILASSIKFQISIDNHSLSCGFVSHDMQRRHTFY